MIREREGERPYYVQRRLYRYLRLRERRERKRSNQKSLNQAVPNMELLHQGFVVSGRNEVSAGLPAALKLPSSSLVLPFQNYGFSTRKSASHSSPLPPRKLSFSSSSCAQDTSLALKTLLFSSSLVLPFQNYGFSTCKFASHSSLLPPRKIHCICQSSTKEPTLKTFSGLGDVEDPVLLCETRTLPAVLSLLDAREALLHAVTKLQFNSPHLSSGIIRFQVGFSREVKALHWLQSQPHCEELSPRIYFSTRGQRGEGFHEEKAEVLKNVAGIGSAVLFRGQKSLSSRDWKCVKRFLSKDSPLIRAYGAIRFNADMEPSEEWRPFGSFFFSIPQVDLCECSSCSLLAVSIAWDDELGREFDNALFAAKEALLLLSDNVSMTSRSPLLRSLLKEHTPSEQEWHRITNDLLDILVCNERDQPTAPQQMLAERIFHNAVGISKVVLARKTTLKVDVALEPLSIVSLLQGRDPNAYQFCIQLPNQSAFIGSSPERLFYKDGVKVYSEAVAATRAWGVTESKDNGSSIELLLSTKDHIEFDVVMETIKQRLEVVCKNVKVKSYKGLIKQANVQHLYGRFVGQLCDDNGEFELLSVLHPTPAVCGQPQDLAKKFLKETEKFDRGLYAGPVGWISGDKAEFAVAIRSSLLEPLQIAPPDNKASGTQLSLFAGVGIVKGAKASSEWKELNLKIKQFEALLQDFSPLQNAVNTNALWARLIIEECCRLGVTYFCIAPGSRSSPLAVAASENYKANCVSCIDERSLAFHALGYGRGAHTPAVVITSSGTAVSNLLPAVVEANEDCVPLVLLTADRPPEMQQTGANQTIDQVKHFGSFVRYQMNLPPSTDKIQARMVLTSVDAAVFRAMSSPMGAVHINIGFREPLAGIPDIWDPVCLKGLERWASQSQPFTKYVRTVAANVSKQGYFSCSQVKEISDLISCASRGLLVVGGLQKTEETRSVLLLAKHLGWPVAADILSGIRLRHTDLEDVDEKLCIIDYFDHVLLSIDAYDSIKPDLVLQVGSRLTSKRLAQFLEICQPSAYILVEGHPFRHDPSHLLTHRVHGCVVEFVSQILSCTTPTQSQDYAQQLKLLSDVTGQELKFQLEADSTLTEPLVAQVVAKSLTMDSAFFLGNSMAVRDVDMYSGGGLTSTYNALAEVHGLPTTTVRTAGNRGASGIDGILSTAIGLAAGSGQRVTLLVGDISFLHDANGLMLLAPRAGQPPVVVVVVNNSGGGIFSLLPIAKTAPGALFTKFFTTPCDVSIRQLCLAHRVNHTLVQSRQQLVDVLEFIQTQQLNWIVEVKVHSNVEENAMFHRHLQSSAKKATKRALQVISRGDDIFGQMRNWTIEKAAYYPYRFHMSAKPTSTVREETCNSNYRQGFIFCIQFCNGICGYGEVAPLEGLHKENLQDAEEQLRLLGRVLLNAKVNNTLALLNGCFARWLSKYLGIMPETLFPSVRCGLEMAVLGALAAANSCNLAGLFQGHKSCQHPKTLTHRSEIESLQKDHSKIRICGLLDSFGSPLEMASSALELVQQGFCTLKVKVARRVSPMEDAAVLLAIRETVGPKIHLRADANQRWTFAQAVEFACSVQGCGLEYLEEPLKDPKDLLRFCKETGLPVAIDESIDKNADNLSEVFSHTGLAAAIIKPSSVGGFERAAGIVKWAQSKGMLAVISSAFESSISLAAFAQFAAFVDEWHIESMTTKEVHEKGPYLHCTNPPVAHGLGTFMWLGNDVLQGNNFPVKSTGDKVEVSVRDCANTFQNLILNKETVQMGPCEANIHSKMYTVRLAENEFKFQVLDTQDSTKGNNEHSVLVFFHGFLGSSRDWLPVMHALSVSNRCISIDLPGHGLTKMRKPSSFHKWDSKNLIASKKSAQTDPLSMENAAEALNSLLMTLSEKKVTLVGYSMGARLALYMALRCNQQVRAAVIISGSPGLQEPSARKERVSQDDALSLSFQKMDLNSFLETWYQKPMWRSLRSHPGFANLKGARLQHQDAQSLAKVLSSMSVGRQPSLWKDLVDPPLPLLFVAGKKDIKFVQIARKMKECQLEESLALDSHGHLSSDGNEEENKTCTMEEKAPLQTKHGVRKKFTSLLELDNTGHAVHIENPLLLVNGISKFVSQLT